MKHTCSTIVFHCIDFRFTSAIKMLLEKEKLLGDADVVSIAGCVKNLVTPRQPSDAEFFIHQLQIAKTLHNTHRAIFINHIDCGAYGGRAAFNTAEEERNLHIEHLSVAEKMIIERFPDMHIRLILAHIDDEGTIHFEEVMKAIS